MNVFSGKVLSSIDGKARQRFMGGGAVYQITITFNEQPIRVRSWSRKAEAVAVAAAEDIVHG